MKIHIVQKGDTLWKIAKKYGVDFEELKKMNSQLSNPDLIMPGMKIKVPSNGVPVKKEAQVKESVKETQKKEAVAPTPPKPKEKPQPSVVSPEETPQPSKMKPEPPKAVHPFAEKPMKSKAVMEEDEGVNKAPVMPNMPNMPMMPKAPTMPEVDINNYYLMNMNVQQPPVPPMPMKPQMKPDMKPEMKPQVKPDMKPEMKPQLKPDMKQPMKPDNILPGMMKPDFDDVEEMKGKDLISPQQTGEMEGHAGMNMPNIPFVPYGQPFGQQPYGQQFAQQPYGQQFAQQPFGAMPFNQAPYGYNPYAATTPYPQAGMPYEDDDDDELEMPSVPNVNYAQNPQAVAPAQTGPYTPNLADCYPISPLMPGDGFGYNAAGPFPGYGMPLAGYPEAVSPTEDFDDNPDYDHGTPAPGTGFPGGYGMQQPFAPNPYGAQAPFGGVPGGFAAQAPYGGAPGGFGAQAPFGGAPGGFGAQAPYGAAPGGFGAQAPYGGAPGGFGAQAPYGGVPGGFGAQAPYGGAPGPYGAVPGGFTPSPHGGPTGYGSPSPGGFGVNPYQGVPGMQQPGFGFQQAPYGGFAGANPYDYRQNPVFGEPDLEDEDND
ncbi:SafA/ExsA family spore coat assembly protein [Bacillus sp. HMF5848]|uniref:SafA/ExsA family spore coat assembly protein n=1 Tax=Bacillus sp. HMF5848 TaxID=2495421 RepID=UPI000F78CECD|nr:SafA/ExsA family spore coat assembly protein [Bacillus sp. HMF5848]RSK28001.1 SafA/ExsA family spore coat assembly protein [Bacillus sp. HMF5848]